LKYGKKFTVLTKNLDEESDAITKEESFINALSSSDSTDTLKGFLVNVLGKFLLLSAAGKKQYEFEILNQKLLRSGTQLLNPFGLQIPCNKKRVTTFESHNPLIFSGPTWARTRDHLIMSQVL
jgi:hypothetical protein